jgi:AcrR family transcriptional regulator
VITDESRAKESRWERRPEERPRELLDAALCVFAERGYRNTRLEEVAEAAGVTKGTIYHYFATKEDLLRRAIDEHHDETFGQLDAIAGEVPASASERIHRLVRRTLGDAGSARRNVLRLLLQGIAHEVPEVHQQWLANGPFKVWRLLAALVREGQQSGEFRCDVDADVLVRTLLSGLLLQVVWQPYSAACATTLVDEDRLIGEAVDFFLHGLRPIR